jgi:hypothetical protein
MSGSGVGEFCMSALESLLGNILVEGVAVPVP